jgi:hypothetical protein
MLKSYGDCRKYVSLPVKLVGDSRTLNARLVHKKHGQFL